MKKAKKNEEIKKENRVTIGVNHSAPMVFHAPSKQAVENATDYVAERFGRALTRLSDR